MIAVRPSNERGRTRTNWLDSRHSFSFNHYYDPRHMGFQSLRVINEDWIAGGAGFGTHPHRDMEILTYVLSGTVAHRDSTGGVGLIGPGEVQRMTAGTGITHSEYNHSDTEEVHLFQVWLLPERTGLTPGYEQKQFSQADRRDRLFLVASPDGTGALKIHQDARFYIAAIGAGKSVAHELPPSRHAWVQVAVGVVTVNGETLRAGDGAAISDETRIEIVASEDAEVLLFDLAPLA